MQPEVPQEDVCAHFCLLRKQMNSDLIKASPATIARKESFITDPNKWALGL